MTQKTLEVLNGLVSKGKRDFDPNETNKLLNMYGPKLWSWGISKRFSLKTKGLVLLVNGHHHKGYVLISLDGSDLYCVDIVSTRGEVLETMKDIYFDELFNRIDKRIEYVPEYGNN